MPSAAGWSDGCVDVVPAPTLTSLNPATGAQGATVNVILVGTSFTAASAVAVSGAGVAVQNVVFVSDVGLTANFVIGVGAAVSTRTVTVTTASGTSNAVNFAVTSGIAAISGRELWLNATDNTTLTIATGVSAWADVTGNGRVVTQATGAAQPTLVAAAIGGLQALRFDGVNDTLSLAWPNSAQLNQGSTVFVVTTPRFVPNGIKNNPLIRWLPSNANGMQAESTVDPNVPSRGVLEAFTATNAGLVRASPAAQVTQTARLQTVLISLGIITLYKNGVVDGGPTSGFATITTSVGDTLLLGRDEIVANNFGQYDIGEVIIFSRTLTTAEHVLIEAILMAKWGL